MRPVLALDIDGVLNSHAWWDRRAPRVPHADHDNRDEFDPQAIALLDHILSVTDADVVVSSVWRKGRTVEQLRELLASVGLTRADQVVGTTPEVWFHYGLVDKFGDDRGVEIAMWLNKHRPEGCVFAIVDDDGDMWELKHRWVHTPHAVGLTKVTADKLICLLSETEPTLAPFVSADWEDRCRT